MSCSKCFFGEKNCSNTQRLFKLKPTGRVCISISLIAQENGVVEKQVMRKRGEEGKFEKVSNSKFHSETCTTAIADFYKKPGSIFREVDL